MKLKLQHQQTADLLLSPHADIPAEESEAEQENMSPDDLSGEQAGATPDLVMTSRKSPATNSKVAYMKLRLPPFHQMAKS